MAWTPANFEIPSAVRRVGLEIAGHEAEAAQL